MARHKTFAIEVALDKAIELFSERGYHSTSIQEIAAHLKLSRSSIYATFRSKPALFVQAVRRHNAECRAPGLSELRGAASPRAALVRVFKAAGGGGQGTQRRARFLLIETATGLTQRDPEIARLVEETIEDIESRFRDAIERGQAAAEIDDGVDPATVARVLLSLYLGVYTLTGAQGAAAEAVLNAVQQQVETLLHPPHGAPLVASS